MAVARYDAAHRRPACATPPPNASARRSQPGFGVTPNVGAGGHARRRLASYRGHCWMPLFSASSQRFRGVTPPWATTWLRGWFEKNRTPSEWRAVSRFWLISSAEPVDNSKLGAISSMKVTASLDNPDLTLNRFKVYRAHTRLTLMALKPNKCSV